MNFTIRVFNKIRKERLRQKAKWGEQRHADTYWLGILMEEVGETSKEIIEGRWCQEELIQAAAVAVAWLEDLEYRDALVNDEIDDAPPVAGAGDESVGHE